MDEGFDQKVIQQLIKKVEELAIYMEKMKLAEYVELLGNIPRLLFLNFISGLARGLGMAVGFTILGAVVIYLLQRSFVHNLPLIGRFIADIVVIVQDHLK